MHTDYSQTNLPIKSWAEDDRPREKMLLKGKQALSKAEFIAILLRSGSRNESAVELAKRILNSVNDSISALSKLSVKELMKFKGVGEAKAISIVAALALAKYISSDEVLERKTIQSSGDAFEIFQSLINNPNYEEFWILLLDRSNKILRPVCISEGGMSGTVVDPKKIFKIAIDNNATSLIVCHNHPSGNLQPSESDIKLTKKLKEGGQLLDISILDHLILGEEKYLSFADENIF
jgi:DNA repair protein RadC